MREVECDGYGSLETPAGNKEQPVSQNEGEVERLTELRRLTSRHQ